MGARQIETETVSVWHNGYKMTFTGLRNDHITAVMRSGAIYEADLLQEILERYGKGGYYVDFGAFIGTHSVFFAKVCGADRVTSVEANPLAFHLLAMNLYENDCTQVEALPVAAGREAARVRMERTGSNGGNWTPVPVEHARDSVPMIRSGALITAKPKLIKIDCEAATLDVLYGARDEIGKWKPVLVIEAEYGRQFDGINAILTQMEGYKLTGTFCATPTHIYEPNDE